MEPVRLVLTGGRIAATLLGDHVDENRAAEGASLAKRPLGGRLIMAVNRAEVLQPKILEHALRCDDVLQTLLHPMQRLVHRRTHHRRAVQGCLLYTSPSP